MINGNRSERKRGKRAQGRGGGEEERGNERHRERERDETEKGVTGEAAVRNVVHSRVELREQKGQYEGGIAHYAELTL